MGKKWKDYKTGDRIGTNYGSAVVVKRLGDTMNVIEDGKERFYLRRVLEHFNDFT